MLQTLISMIERIGESLPIFGEYTTLFPNAPRIQTALCKTFTEILQFFVEVRKLMPNENNSMLIATNVSMVLKLSRWSEERSWRSLGPTVLEEY